MIDEAFLKEYAARTGGGLLNVAREYLQHLFLTNFYRQPNCEKFLFKGGTALRLVFGSPRFSEDIDFTSLINSKTYEGILENVWESFEREGIKSKLIESKATTGGHLAIVQFHLFGEKITIRNEVSSREKEIKKGESFVITSEIVPSYTVYLLPREKLVTEKIQALLTRGKPRDLFDLYFILRKEELRKVLRVDKKQRKQILDFLKKQNRAEINKELKILLPPDFWQVIKDLPTAIINQLAF